MKALNRIFLLSLGVFLMASSCKDETTSHRQYTQEELLELNRKKVSNQSEYIDRFIESAGWEMKSSGSGLRYDIYYKSGDTTSARKNMWAQLSYDLMLLDSTKIANSEITGLKRFRIDEGNVETGLHEAVKLLSPGDSARFILPSHIAYGLTGTENIPSNAPLLYDVCLVSLN
jgi:FKBP-type peptidyl-prolyl cis-trans isomerase